MTNKSERMVEMTEKYKKRVENLTSMLDVDAVIITEPTNVFYFTGCFIEPHERMLALLVDVKSNDTALMFPALDQEVVNDEATVDNHLPYSDGEDPFRQIFEHLMDAETIGIEGGHVTYNRYQKLLENYTAEQIQSIEPEINRLRGKKDEDDREKLQEAVDITEKALADLVNEPVSGRTEKEIAEFLLRKVKEYGAVDVSFGPLVLTGENSALPHGTSGDTTVEPGHFLLIDFGVVTKDRYVSDMTRTFIIGDPTEEQEAIYNAVLRANEAGIKKAQAGTQMNALDEAARHEIMEDGYGEYFTHRIGHGLGLGLHEAPSLDAQNTDKLENGHVITIEPGVYKTGFGGVRIEDMLYIDDTTHVFTKFPKDIDSITIEG
ncbi:M24 family metallopeptidase [Salinicoccus hispanicus]|uniref:M24 family metallopeptidase n=2 Tax=Salinicoccus hispanicus TaxID=157225 RepID=A0A6N8U018_9STAP|nr:M24 family metallopeptidase [Salinicoccus hispanicus]